MWKVFQDAKTFHCRPSQLLGINDEYQAFCFDEAVAYLGNSLQYEMDKVEGKTSEDTRRKRQHILNGYLFPDEDDVPQKAGFADPALFFS